MKDKIKSIAIIFGDNDFSYTLTSLLETVKNILYYRDDITHDVLTKIIFNGLRFHYVAFQNQYAYKYHEHTMEEHFDYIEEYLKDGVKVFYNEEANVKYCTEDHDSAAFHLEVKSGQINRF